MRNTLRAFFLATICSQLLACSSTILEYDKVDKLEENKEYDQLMKVQELPDEESGAAALSAREKLEAEQKEKPNEPTIEDKMPPRATVKLQPKKKNESAKKTPVAKKEKQKSKMESNKKRLPEHEDAEKFDGRRPTEDPFRVGEKVRLSMTYFNITAGYMDLLVKPFVKVNGEKAYHFAVDVKSNTLFSRIYTVDDTASTYVDYDTLLPYNLDIKVRESKQIKEIRSYLNNKTLEGSYWEKKVTDEKGEQERSKKWQIKPFSQNVISAIFYLRNFHLTEGKKLQFRVADDGKNYMFKGEVVRKEKLKTEVGTLDTVVVRPQITIDGVFKPMGEILIWLTDDNRKLPVRIESKIKIGTIIAKLKSIDKGVE